jgi:hypothetical protein
LTLLLSIKLSAQQQQVDTSVKEIILVFKTHFDIGYTDFAEAVVQKYSTTMMQNALAIVEKNKNLPQKNNSFGLFQAGRWNRCCNEVCPP